MRWLHISDLHIDESYTNGGQSRMFLQSFLHGDSSEPDFTEGEDLHNGGLEFQVKQHPVDCIVFTGDLFNQGNWGQGQKKAAINFLAEIYKICSQQGNWGWHEGERMERLFYCPGNHDVLRSAYTTLNESVIIHRKEIIRSSVDGDGYFDADEDNYQVLTDKSFGLFEASMQECGEYWSGDNNEFRYEFKVFSPERVIPNNPPHSLDPKWSSVVGLNTALLAGQECSSDSADKELEDSWNLFWQMHSQMNIENALKAYGCYFSAYKKKAGIGDGRRKTFVVYQP